MLYRGMDLDLPQVRVAAILVIGQNGDLNEEGADGTALRIFGGDVDPARWLVQVDRFQFLKIVKAATNSY